MTFGQMLRQFREARGLSPEALARESGVPVATVTRFEGGQRAPSLRTTAKLAKGLGVNPMEFADCEDVQRRSAASQAERETPASDNE